MDGQEPWALAFGMKSAVEVERDGVVGLLTRGYASLYDLQDQAGEYQVPGAFRDIVDTWGRQRDPMVDFDHGFDPILGAVQIGKGVHYRLDDQGLYCECFIPRDPVPPFRENVAAKTARWRQVYDGIKSGAIRGYSVTGVFTRAGKALVRWSMSALAITPRPCLPQAQFALGTKAVKAMMDGGMQAPTGASYPLSEQSTHGVLSRPAFGTVMRTAQQHKDRALHDHLLARPPELHGTHDAETCPICTDRRGAAGIKADLFPGAKAGKDGPDGDYLVVEDDGTQHLRVRRDGTPDHGLMGGAWAALHGGYRGNTYEGPDSDKALAKLTALYKAEGMDTPAESAVGKKTAIAEAEAVLAQFNAGIKAGARFSAASKATMQRVITMLQELMAEEKAEQADESAEPAATAAG